MLYLKEMNIEDSEKEWLYIKDIPEDENGFANNYNGVSFDEFTDKVIPHIIDGSKGIGLPEGYVPDTWFVLWDDEEPVGIFKIRHYLNDALRNGAGHIGYSIRQGYRGKGYGTEGLRLAIEKAKSIIKEDEIYMSVNIDNPASLRIMEKNGAYIHHSDEKHHYTRIKIQRESKNDRRGKT
jgi:predicted acetyltransferase